MSNSRCRFRSPIRPPAASLILGCSAVLIAGCAGVPASSAARAIEKLPAGVVSAPAGVTFPLSPKLGESPYDIVQDFLTAAGITDARHQAARQFLAPAAAASWADTAGAVVVQKPPYIAVEESGGSVTVRASQVGAVDARGSYSPVSQQYAYRFRLQKVDGEWRIANPPPGLLVSADDFPHYFREINLYFLDQPQPRPPSQQVPTSRFLVPDPRWFAEPVDQLPAILINALLDGPSPALVGAVRSDLSTAASLAGAVEQTEGVLKVSLSGLADLVSDRRAGASAQIVWTLSQLGTTDVEIYNDGQPLAEPGGGIVQHLSDWRSYDSDSLPVRTPGYFVRNGSILTTDGVSLPTSADHYGSGYTSVAVSRDLAQLAAIAPAPGGGQGLYVGGVGDAPSLRLSGASLTPPTWGASVDEVWTVRTESAGSEVLAVPRGRGEPVQVAISAADISRLGTIQSLRLSRDGCRVAIVAGPPAQGSLYVGAVTRGDGAISIVHIRSVADGLTDVTDAGWSSKDFLVALSGGGTDAALWQIRVDGAATSQVSTAGLPGPPAALAVANGLPTMVVANGGIWQFHTGWAALAGASPASAPAYPG